MVGIGSWNKNIGNEFRIFIFVFISVFWVVFIWKRVDGMGKKFFYFFCIREGK